jgi:hypothetical protein
MSSNYADEDTEVDEDYLFALERTLTPEEFVQAKRLPKKYVEKIFGINKLAFGVQQKECEEFLKTASALVYAKDERLLRTVKEYGAEKWSGMADQSERAYSDDFHWAGYGYWWASCDLSPADHGSYRLGGYIPEASKESIRAARMFCASVWNIGHLSKDIEMWITSTLEALAFRVEQRGAVRFLPERSLSRRWSNSEGEDRGQKCPMRRSQFPQLLLLQEVSDRQTQGLL